MTKRRELNDAALSLVATRFKVLGDSIRLRILQTLQDGEHNVGDLTRVTGASQPAVSKHLKALHEAGLVARRPDGNAVFYRIADPLVLELCDLVCSSIQERLVAQAAVFEPPPRGKGRR